VMVMPYYAGQNCTAIKNKILKKWQFAKESEGGKREK